MTHEVTLTYYNTDDGVYLVCNCGKWERNLGFWATPEEAVDAANEHRNAKKGDT